MKVTFLIVLLLPLILTIAIPDEQETLQQGGVYHFKLNDNEVKINDRDEFMKFVMLHQDKVLKKDNSFLQTTNTSPAQNLRMHNYKNIQYTADLGIGEKFNTFKVVLDTGSANLWIDSDRCAEEGCEKHKQYKHTDSQTFVGLGQDLDVEFGSGELKGQINADTVYFGELELSRQNLVEIVEENGAIFRDLDFDGILGLAYPKMAPQNFNPFFDNLMQSRKLEKNQFAFYFAKDANDISHSEFTLGGYNQAHVDGDIHYHDVIDKYYWMLKADNILVDGKDIGLCHGEGCRLIMDTGTSIMSAPIDDLGTLLRTLDVKSHCHELKTLPNLSFMIDDIEYMLTPEEYVKPTTFDASALAELNDGDDLQALIEVNNWDCIAAFMPLDIQEPQGPAWIMGDTFLRKFYSIYDRDNNSVGLGLAKQ